MTSNSIGIPRAISIIVACQRCMTCWGWREKLAKVGASQVFVPRKFDDRDAFQCGCDEEGLVVGGMPQRSRTRWL